MPYRLDTHVLTVDANVIHKVDTANPTNLYSMWTVFSRCADSVEQGRRLENLSWRIWQKEQLVTGDNKTASTALSNIQSQPQDIPSDNKFPDLPQLSGSVESVADDEAVEITSVSAPLEILRPRIRREDSAASSRSRRERHISSDDFEKMIMSIVKDKAPLSAPTNPAPAVSRKEVVVPTQPSGFQRTGSTTTESQSPSKNSDAQSEESHPSPKMPQPTTTVRGFSPAQVSMPQITTTAPMQTSTDAIPEPTSAPAPKAVQSRKQPTTFTIGGSYSSSEQGQSVESRKPLISALAKKAQFCLGGSSEEESVKGSLRPQDVLNNVLSPTKKQASFSNRVTTHYVGDDNAIDSDSEGDYIDESAIDDDDESSEWEDSNEDSGKSSMDGDWFQKNTSNVILPSRRSLITLGLAQNEERAKALSNHASQSTSAIGRPSGQGNSLGVSPNDSDDGPLMMKGARQSNLRPINEIPRSSAQPIAASSRNQAQAALSPRTTRRNMLATELTESLRRHLLWERSQKSSTANAVLKRRHTAQDVANLKQYPEKPCMKKSEDVNATSWNQYFAKEAFEGYHSKGW